MMGQMKLERLGWLRQLKGYSMHMMADFLHVSLEDYIELEFQLREAGRGEKKILQELLEDNTGEDKIKMKKFAHKFGM